MLLTICLCKRLLYEIKGRSDKEKRSLQQVLESCDSILDAIEHAIDDGLYLSLRETPENAFQKTPSKN